MGHLNFATDIGDWSKAEIAATSEPRRVGGIGDFG
jgi:hypothetical protein